MYEAVHVSPDGQTTPARYALTAARHGYEGVILLADSPEWDPDRLDRIAQRYDIDVRPGARLTFRDRGRIGGRLESIRSDVDVLWAGSESPDISRVLARQERVDVLGWPLTADEELSHTVATTAKEHGIFIALDLGPILRATAGRRVAALGELDRLYTVLDHFEVPYVVSVNPTSHLELRAPRELRAVGEAIGLSTEAIDRGLRGWGDIIERSRRARDDTFIEPGIRRGSNETNDR